MNDGCQDDYISQTFNELRKHLTAKEHTDLNGSYFLNVRYIQNDDRTWTADQHSYIENLRLKFPIFPQTRQHPTTQLPANYDIGLGGDSTCETDVLALEEHFNFQYSSLAGSLIYLLETREDVRASTVFVCTHSKLPGRKHFLAINHLLNYIYKTKHLVFNFAKRYAKTHSLHALTESYPPTPKDHIRYLFSPRLANGKAPELPDGLPPNKSGFLEVFHCFDAEHKSHTNGKAILAYAIFFGNSLVQFNVKIPKLTAPDTTCAEAQASSAGAASLSNIVSNLELFDIYKLDRSNPPPTFCDNKSLVECIINHKDTPIPHTQPHIRLHAQRLHDYHRNGDTALSHIYSALNTSDIGTKTLPKIANAIHTASLLNMQQTDDKWFTRILQPIATRAKLEHDSLIAIIDDADSDSNPDIDDYDVKIPHQPSLSPTGGG